MKKRKKKKVCDHQTKLIIEPFLEGLETREGILTGEAKIDDEEEEFEGEGAAEWPQTESWSDLKWLIITAASSLSNR